MRFTQFHDETQLRGACQAEVRSWAGGLAARRTGLFQTKNGLYARSVLELGVERTMKHGSGEVA